MKLAAFDATRTRALLMHLNNPSVSPAILGVDYGFAFDFAFSITFSPWFRLLPLHLVLLFLLLPVACGLLCYSLSCDFDVVYSEAQRGIPTAFHAVSR
jgi:ABC-type Fe3+-siderophore transport system permease subunit